MPEKEKISIILFTVRSSPLPYAEKLKKLRDIGYRSIQGGPAADLSIAEHKALLDGLGLEMSCFGASLDALEKEPEKFIENCHAFGCDEIMIGTMPTEMRADREGYLRAIDLMNKVGRALAKDGVYLAYHNHAQEFRRFKDGKTGMDLLYEGLDPSAVHFLLDTHWVQSGGGDILEWIKKCNGRLQYLHVKDYRLAPANYLTGIGDTEKQFSQIGGGNLAWPQIIETALANGVKSFIVEQDNTYGQDPFVCAEESFKALKSFGL